MRWLGLAVKTLSQDAALHEVADPLTANADMLGGGGGGWDDFENDLDGQDNDEDLMGDQIMQVDMAVSFWFRDLA